MRTSIKLAVMAILFCFIFFSSPLTAQEITREQKEETVNNLAKLLEDYYVFPDVGKDCATHIKDKLKNGSLDNVSDKKELADLLTTELQSISKDKHMRVRVPGGMMQQDEPSNPLLEQYKFMKEMGEENYGFRNVEMLDGGIGYIDLRGFANIDKAYEVAVLAMKFIKNSNAVIFDLRKNGGGSPEMIKFILSYFFEKPTHINSLYWREGDRTIEFWTSEKVDGVKMSDVPLFVLTSNYTFSGGEEFTYNVQTQKRGLIIGEVTGGGANPGSMFRAGNGISIFIPTGRAINPVTNTNWEGVGVKPDIETTADEALEKAVELAKEEAEKYRQKILDTAVKEFENLFANLNAAEAMYDKNPGEAEEKVYSSLETVLNKNLIGEPDINMLGYEFLGEQKTALAISVLKFNTEKFPESSNVWDSLGEAYMINGDKELAISNYKKSLELNPENENAKQMIAKMQSGN
jgi:hypothetical protein